MSMTIAYDIKLMKPGCVLIQAHMGATVRNYDFELYFPCETWALAPTENMRLYTVTDAQLSILAQKTRQHHGLAALPAHR